MLKFERIESAVDVLFWFALREHKLNNAKLNDEALPLRAFSTFASHPALKPRLQLLPESLPDTHQEQHNSYSVMTYILMCFAFHLLSSSVQLCFF